MYRNLPCAGHEVVWKRGDLAPLIRDLGTRWRSLISLILCRFTSNERHNFTRVRVGYVSHRAGLDALKRRRRQHNTTS